MLVKIKGCCQFFVGLTCETLGEAKGGGGRVKETSHLRGTKERSSRGLGISSHFHLRFGPVASAQCLSSEDTLLVTDL